MAEPKVGSSDYVPFLKVEQFEQQIGALAETGSHIIPGFETNRLAIICCESREEGVLKGAFRDAADIMENRLGYEYLEIGIWVKKDSPNFMYGRHY